MTDNDKRGEDGFELEGEFYRWHVTDSGKDLMLIDAFAKMPIAEFFETIEDNFDRGRAPILLALMATSIRALHPDWTVERITRKVMNLNLSEVVFIEADVEEAIGPPSEEGSAQPLSLTSTSSESKPSSSLKETETSEMSSETQELFTALG